MKYLILVWAGLWRKKPRTVFTVVSLSIAFLLFGILQGINLGVEAVIRNLGVERLYVQNRINMGAGLPVTHLNKIKSMEGVRAVTQWVYFGGFYQTAENRLPAFAVDASAHFEVFPKIRIAQSQLDAMLKTRTGAIVSDEIAAQYGWKVGDKVPVGSSIWTMKDGSKVWYFDIVGIANVSAYGRGFPAFYINYDYFEEARVNPGRVTMYVVNINDPDRASILAKNIDALFVNSGAESKTQTEQDRARQQIKRIGDINFIANSIIGAVLFALLCLTGNTMMQSVRERIPEFAVLKTLGYSDGRVMTLVIAEALVLCMFSAVVGLALTKVAFKGVTALFGSLPLSFSAVPIGLGVALVLAIVSSVPPALRAKRLSIVDALAGR